MKVFKIIYLIVLVIGLITVMSQVGSDDNNILDAISSEMIYCEDGKVLPENEGKLVMISGIPQVNDEIILEDKDFGITSKDAVMLHRKVTQYRYKHSTETVEEYKDGKSKVYDPDTDRYYENEKVTRTERIVVRAWVDSEGQGAEKVGKYENPPSTVPTTYFYKPVHVGEFELDIEKVRGFLAYKTLTDLKPGYSDLIGNYTTLEYTGVTYLSNSKGEEAEIGDYHVSFALSTFKENPAFTVVGKQVGNTIEPYPYEKYTIDEMYDKIATREEVLEGIKDQILDDKISIVAGYSIIVIIGIFIFKNDVVNLVKKLLKKIKGGEQQQL